MKRDIRLDSIRKPKSIILITVSALIFIAIGFIFSKTNLTNYNDFNNYKNSEFKNVYVEITDLPIEFQVNYKGKVQNFYIVQNGDNKYIVKLTKDQHNKIQKQYDNNIQSFTYRIEGRSYSNFENLKKASLKVYNEIEDKNITNSNYVEHFGESYIDATEGNVSTIISYICYICALLFLFIDLLVIIQYIYTIIKLNKSISLYGKEELEKEINDPESIIFKKAGICLAKQYIISTALNFNVISYDNIYWMYISKRSMNFITITKCIIIATKEGKLLPIAYDYNERELNEIINKIHEKNNSILIGYSSENRKSFQKYLKEFQ